jgi:CHAD domain-containing protein
MFESDTPVSLFRTQIQILRASLPGVLDGQAGAIHDSRIATRRIRELLPLLTRHHHQQQNPADGDDLYKRFRRLGRSLGRVRDADVRLALLSSLETRMPHAAPQLVVLRQQRALLHQVIDAEIHQLHSRYLARREGLLAICQPPAARSPILIPSMLTAGAMALSSGVFVYRRRRAS